MEAFDFGSVTILTLELDRGAEVAVEWFPDAPGR